MLWAQAWMLAASDWRRGGSFCMAQEIKKHGMPMVVGRMQTATELKQSMKNSQHRLVPNMDCNAHPESSSDCPRCEQTAVRLPFPLGYAM